MNDAEAAFLVARLDALERENGKLRRAYLVGIALVLLAMVNSVYGAMVGRDAAREAITHSLEAVATSAETHVQLEELAAPFREFVAKTELREIAPVLRARRLEIIDGSNVVRARIEIDSKNNATFVLANDQGVDRVGLLAQSGPESNIALLDSVGYPGIELAFSDHGGGRGTKSKFRMDGAAGSCEIKVATNTPPRITLEDADSKTLFETPGR